MVLSTQEITHMTKIYDDNCVQMGINTIDVETNKWRNQVTSELKVLKKRIKELERHTVWQRESVKQITSFAESQTDTCCGLSTSVHLVRTSWASRLQCILLMVVIIGFSFCAVSYFLEARRNEHAMWKPMKINKTIEYGTTSTHYEMPYIYIAFKVTYTDSLSEMSDILINETLTGIQESQLKRESCSTKYYSGEQRVFVGCEWLVARYEQLPGTDKLFYGYFSFKLDSPTPDNGSFVWSVILSPADMMFNDSFEVTGFWVSITRDEKLGDFSNFIYLDADKPLSGGTSLWYTVDYTESVLDETHYFTNSIAWSSELVEDDNGMLRISAKPNLRVEYWTEYVAFGYSHWIFGMGGLYNFFALGFFYTAYYAAVCCNDNWSMGILPRLSFVFNNLEMILWIKHNTLSKTEENDRGIDKSMTF